VLLEIRPLAAQPALWQPSITGMWKSIDTKSKAVARPLSCSAAFACTASSACSPFDTVTTWQPYDFSAPGQPRGHRSGLAVGLRLPGAVFDAGRTFAIAARVVVERQRFERPGGLKTGTKRRRPIGNRACRGSARATR